MPYNFYRMRPIRMHIKHLVHTTLPTWLQKYVLARGRTVMLKRDSVDRIMRNLTPTSKDFTIKPPQCTCQHILNVTRCTKASIELPPRPTRGTAASVRAPCLRTLLR